MLTSDVETYAETQAEETYSEGAEVCEIPEESEDQMNASDVEVEEISVRIDGEVIDVLEEDADFEFEAVNLDENGDAYCDDEMDELINKVLPEKNPWCDEDAMRRREFREEEEASSSAVEKDPNIDYDDYSSSFYDDDPAEYADTGLDEYYDPEVIANIERGEREDREWREAREKEEQQAREAAEEEERLKNFKWRIDHGFYRF